MSIVLSLIPSPSVLALKVRWVTIEFLAFIHIMSCHLAIITKWTLKTSYSPISFLHNIILLKRIPYKTFVLSTIILLTLFEITSISISTKSWNIIVIMTYLANSWCFSSWDKILKACPIFGNCGIIKISLLTWEYLASILIRKCISLWSYWSL